MNENENGFNPIDGNEPNAEPAEDFTPHQPLNEEPINSEPVNDEPKYTAGSEYSHYCDPVDDESQYSPYAEKQTPPPEPPQFNQQPNYGNTGAGYSQPQYGSQPYSNYSNPQQNTYVSSQPDNTPPVKKKKSGGFKAFIIIVAVIVAATAIIIAAYSRFSNNSGTKEVTTGDSTQLEIADSSSLSESSKDSVAIAEKAQKFNVGILLYGRTQSFAQSATTSLVGEGSGIIMGEDSTGKYTYIITCAHVISEVDSSNYTMVVQDCDGNNYDGIMVGYDEKTDVGVIKIEKTGLTAAEFGDSSNLVIGQQVYAIGNPGGVEFFGSFTNGMISAIDRPINSESGYEMKCIQHTTPINSGNSGGALLNESGQVIGINSSKIVSTGYEGMAFAIPITDAKEIIDDIIANGHVTNRPKLGISYAAASQYSQYGMIVAVNNLPSGSLIIASISDDSDLANTKAKIGDMIIAVDGEELTSADVLLEKIQNGKVGDSLKLTLCRVNEDYSIDKFDVTVKLVEDDGTSSETEQETTTQSYQDYFDQFFGSGY